MKPLHVFLLSVVLFGAGTVTGAYVQYHRDLSLRQPPIPYQHCYLVYNGTLPQQLRQFLPGLGGSQRYEVYAC